MKTLPPSRFVRAICVALLAVAGLLPYASPGICSVLDRMGHGMDMRAGVGEVTLHASEAPDACCSMTGCGATHVGPLAFAMPNFLEVPTHERPEITVARRPPWTFPPPLTPPPQS